MKHLLFLSLLILVGTFSCKTPSKQSSEHMYTNALINESSPYLIQHAHNPVNWYPWGDEALQKAKTENKMLIISVGYAACHWCHVMEHESFEDTMIANIMNEHFISVKVDREERPDVDNVYMTACHLSSERSCGWPLNAIALPDGRPFWAGTYFPRQQWKEVLNTFIKMKENNPDQLNTYADQITNNIQVMGQMKLDENKHQFGEEELKSIGEQFMQNIDKRSGGRTGAPKFPMPNNYLFLLRYYQQTGDENALNSVMVTLDNMADGGIYDHLGGGFARYSTDANWKIPHFEKMLYDNGQIVSLYAEAYQLTKNPVYKQRLEETLDFVAREMTTSEGGFYSSFDADSEGVEGKFYVWKQREIDSLLGEEAKLFNAYYTVTKVGNWEHGNNILHIKTSKEKLLKSFDLDDQTFETRMLAARNILFDHRKKRIPPLLDDKVLTSWNALMVKGYVDAYRALDKPEYLDAALKNARFINQKVLQKNGALNRNYKDGKSVINGFLDDYALVIDAYIALYQVTFDEVWLERSKALCDYAIEHFFDDTSKMFYYKSKEDTPLIARTMETSDNVIPGSNSVMAKNLFLLGHYYYDNAYLDMSKTLLNNVFNQIYSSNQPNFYSNWCALLSHFAKEPYEVAIVGKDHEKLRKEFDQSYHPNALLLGGETEGNLELLKNKLVEGETYIYVCKNKVCKLPVTEVAAAIKLMK